MKMRVSLTAFFCAFLMAGAAAQAQAPAAEGLYETIRVQVEKELNVEEIDTAVTDFAAGFYYEKWKTDRVDVLAAMQGDRVLCMKKEGRRVEMDRVTCDEVMKGIRTIVSEEGRVRTLARDLVQMIAGQELATSDLFGHPLSLPLDEAAILNVWKTGKGGLVTEDGPTLRTRMLSADVISGPLEQLGGAFTALSVDEQLAVVRRYRHGLRLIQNLRAPDFPAPVPDAQSGEGTERQYEFRDWPAIADALTALWDALPQNPNDYDPPLSGRDVVLLEFPATLLDQALPKNLLVWAHVDADPAHPFGDTGLAFRMPLDTVAPSLMRDPAGANAGASIIRGGRNPPPVPDGVLCSHPLATRGFLCRDSADAGDACDEPAGRDPDAIVLVTCEKGEAHESVSGPDVCRGAAWYDSLEKLTGTGGACTPGNTVRFRNTIGNNMCYIGTCALSLFQLQETAGRSPFLPSDSGSPWFPVTPGRIPGTIVVASPDSPPVLPVYNPAQLLSAFDASLCALAGLPPRTPPVRCLTDESRRLSLPLQEYASTMAHFLQQENAVTQGFAATEDLAPAAGREEGIVLFTDYLRRSMQQLSVMITSATDLLSQMKSIPLPTEMCPMNSLAQ